MRLSFLAFPFFAATGDGGAGGFEDMYAEDDLDAPDVPITPDVPNPNAPGPGPALGELGSQVVIPVTSVTGGEPEKPQQPNTPASSSAEGSFSIPGFTDLNDFAVRAIGAKDGLIQFEGEEGPGTPFKDLTPEDLAMVTKQWLDNLPTAEEKALLAQVRATGSVDNFVRQRAGSIMPQDVATLSDDDVQRQQIQNQYKEFTQEEVEQELAHRKTSALYERQTKVLRDELSATQTKLEKETQDAENQLLVDIARDNRNMAGIVLGEEHINEVLGDLLNPDPTDPTVSIFVKKFDDPKFMYRMAVLDKYADAVIAQLAKQQPKAAVTNQQNTQFPVINSPGRQNNRVVEDAYGE